MIKRSWALTIIIVIVAVGISFFLWSVGIYFFFLPIIFLPFLRFLKIKPRIVAKKACSVCGLSSDGNYCPECGNRL